MDKTENPEIVSEEERTTEMIKWQNIQANYSAMMYILTEQQALIGSLLDTLLANGAVNAAQITKITSIYGNPEVLNPMYNELYKRFTHYFTRIRHVLDNPEEYQPETPFPKGNHDDDGDGGTSDGREHRPTEDEDPSGV